MQVLVTGATGFVGRRLLARLSEEPHVTRAAVRCDVKDCVAPIAVVGDISKTTDWSAALSGVQVVIHAASRVHVMQDAAGDPLAEFRKVNVEGTLNLALQAASAGVRRFIFISSIKVNGEGTAIGHPFTADDIPAPADPYGVSKHEAEQGLRQLAANTGMEVVIIRPPLVYGPGVKANFQTMMRWLKKGFPLPLGAIHNKRSLVALDNLVDLLTICLNHPRAANETFLVSDGEDLSTTELIRRTARAMSRKARLLPVPVWLLEAGAAMLGMRAVSQRLCGSLQVDIGKTRTLLGWDPPVSVDEALSRTAHHFLA